MTHAPDAEARREQLRKHIAAIDGRRPQDGHRDTGFAACPHPDCAAFHQPQAPREDAEARFRALLDEMRTISRVAGQCSVEGPPDTASLMAAAEAERALRWADTIEALLAVSPAAKTECCGVNITGEQRFCPKCGWEARASAAPPSVSPQAEPWFKNLLACRELISQRVSRHSGHHLLAGIDEAIRRLSPSSPSGVAPLQGVEPELFPQQVAAREIWKSWMKKDAVSSVSAPADPVGMQEVVEAVKEFLEAIVREYGCNDHVWLTRCAKDNLAALASLSSSGEQKK